MQNDQGHLQEEVEGIFSLEIILGGQNNLIRILIQMKALGQIRRKKANRYGLMSQEKVNDIQYILYKYR